MQNTFDYVIVGAGSAGCVMAARLSEDPNVSVCLLEAGKKDTNPFIHLPGGLASLLGSRAIDWNYFTEPQVELNNRKLFWPRGKTLGGSSSLNGMCYQRGDLSDYDDWAEAGADGWSAMDALHYFKKSENYSGGADQWHGDEGPLGVRKAGWTHKATKRFVEAGKQAGYRFIEDFHADGREGIGFFDTTIKDGKRCSAAKAYLSPEVQSRSNLTIVTQALAQRVEFDGVEAKSISVDIDGEVSSLVATKEIILSGGAINSPQLLLLSGVGPKDHLEEVGVPIVHDLPGVGGNMQDHLDVSVMMLAKAGSTFGYVPSAMPSVLKAVADYAVNKTGLLASNFAEGNGFAKSSNEVKKADIQFHFLPGMGEDHGADMLVGKLGFTVHACNLYPKSKGTIRLASTNPADHPKIDPQYLTQSEDWDVMIEAGKKAMEIAKQPALAEISKGHYAPEEEPSSNDDWEKFIRERSETIYHPVGTCKMGRADDEQAVTDNQGRVHGVKGLRVVDASLMPLLIGGNTNAPTIMMAEKISKHMREGSEIA